uniref:class I adenylate-forming enzyme family protein n=1 Tax=Nocardioides sp. TaxID=35761 RepID=UPI00286D6B0B
MDAARLSPGSRVALLVPGSHEYVDLVLSLLAAGVFPVPLDPALTAAERTRILAPIEPDLVITDHTEISALLATLDPRRRRALPRGRPIHCTSGTTGTPKGVFSGPLSRADAAALVAEERDLWGFSPDDVNLVLSPLHHSAPLRFAMGTLLAGGRIVLPGRFDAGRITEALRSERPTTMFCVPTHLQRLLAHWDDVGMPDLSSFRLVAHAGAPCPPSLKRRLIEAFPAGTTWEFYGSTEGQFTACSTEDWQRRPGSVGRARPGRSLSIDADSGTIWCEVPSYARFTYWQDPEKTAAAWRGNAFSVFDLGRIDDGYLYL